jgi:beta-glucosidase-like glycosyl hydrolase
MATRQQLADLTSAKMQLQLAAKLRFRNPQDRNLITQTAKLVEQIVRLEAEIHPPKTGRELLVELTSTKGQLQQVKAICSRKPEDSEFAAKKLILEGKVLFLEALTRSR